MSLFEIYIHVHIYIYKYTHVHVHVHIQYLCIMYIRSLVPRLSIHTRAIIADSKVITRNNCACTVGEPGDDATMYMYIHMYENEA